MYADFHVWFPKRIRIHLNSSIVFSVPVHNEWENANIPIRRHRSGQRRTVLAASSPGRAATSDLNSEYIRDVRGTPPVNSNAPLDVRKRVESRKTAPDPFRSDAMWRKSRLANDGRALRKKTTPLFKHYIIQIVAAEKNAAVEMKLEADREIGRGIGRGWRTPPRCPIDAAISSVKHGTFTRAFFR